MPRAARPASKARARRPQPRLPRPFAIRDLPLDGLGALYDQIYRALRSAILSGRVAAGTRLPTTRALAAELGISRNTVVAAFEPLAAEGYVVPHVGAGTFVAPQVMTRGDDVAPRSGERARAARSTAKSSPTPRLSRHGRALAERAPRRLYDDAANREPVPFDFRPCVPDLSGLSRARLDRCRLAYVTPSHQFPTGVVLSLARRQELLAWAGRANAFVLEDDYDSEFRYAGRAIAALKSLDEGDRVLYVGTFSKTLLPALRIAYVALPPSLFEVFRSAKWLADWASPGFEQAVLERFLASGDFERHLRRARTRYAESRDALLESIERELAPWSPRLHDSRAGLHLLLRFPDLSGARPFDWVAAGRGRGLGLYPVAPCHLERQPSELAFVMGFARLPPEVIRRGVRELARLLAAGEGTTGRAASP